MKKLLFLFLFIFVLFKVNAQWHLEVESGLAFQTYNEVRIPNDGGTTFDFTSDFEPSRGVVVPWRLRGGYTFGRNHITALIAPLTIRYGGFAPFDIFFEETWFMEGDFIEGLYKFNSFRLTYRYNLVQTEFWTLGLGITGKIRDARVRLLVQDGPADANDDFGFVPLLNVYASYGAPWGMDAFIEGDGWAVSAGRAFDVFAGLRIPLGQNGAIMPGYRILEGGADVEQVYNFTMIHFAAVGLQWVFR